MKKELHRAAYETLLKERAKQSRIYTQHQWIGVSLAETLEDHEHTSLYIKLAKERNSRQLLELARDIAERKNVKKKGAYFMRLLQKTFPKPHKAASLPHHKQHTKRLQQKRLTL